ncbi:MAG: YggT family protein [Anaerolineales bacterium]|nr:YggT family protein [Anaerolineales bacterium]MCW5854822.1 YggT family protein [Anaerolineales bacterium]
MVQLIRLIVDVLTWMVVLHVLLGYILPPYHALREALERLVEPMLAPIRRFMPPMAGLDFSPLVLIFVLHLLGNMLTRLLVF